MDDLEYALSKEYDYAGLTPSGGKLPYYIDLQTSRLLDVILSFGKQAITQKERRQKRSSIQAWLFARTRPGFYGELNERLHLRYIGQPGGHGTQHHWQLFFDGLVKTHIEQVTQLPAQQIGEAPTSTIPQDGTTREWGGMYFRSEAEIKIATELDKAGVLFFANARGRVSDHNMPLSATVQNGRVELDFLVFKAGKAIVLEVDGSHHNEVSQTIRDYTRDRLLLKEGIPTVRFTAQECLTKPGAVVTEFLQVLSAMSLCQ